MPIDYAWTVQASFPAEENALWWADQTRGDYPQLNVHQAGNVVTVHGVPDRELRDGLTVQAYSRYNAEEVIERPTGRARGVVR